MLRTTREIAALLRIHPKQVYRLIKRGLPVHRIGDEYRFDEAEVLAWNAPSGSLLGDSTRARSLGRPPLVAANGDVAIELVLAAARADGGPLLGFVQSDHATALGLLERGAVIASGLHGSETPASPSSGRLARVHLARREIGLVFPRGAKIKRASGVIGKRLASRPPTAGARAILDLALEREGAESARAHADATLHSSHRDVVFAVVRGEADVGLASQAWAARAGLGFLALASEAYGLVLGADDLGDPHIVALCAAAQTSAYRRDLAAAGYDPRHTGELRYGAAVS